MRRIFLALGLVSAAISSALANRYTDNPDINVNRVVETQFAAIGELESTAMVENADSDGNRRYGTGFLVSPCYAITNAHVVFGDQLEPLSADKYAMIFRVGVSAFKPFLGNTIATPVVWGKQTKNRGQNDWVLLRLRSCIGGRADIG